MCTQPYLKVRWQDGCFLPIIIPPDATGKDIYKMLRFACGPKQELKLTFNDLTIEDDATLKSYGITNGDTLHALILTIPKDNSRMIRSFDAIAREAAKISDVKMDQIETQTENEGGPYKSYNNKNKFVCHDLMKTIIPEKAKEISHKPLPALWGNFNNRKDIINELETSSILSKYSTIEEAGAFFASLGWNQWTW